MEMGNEEWGMEIGSWELRNGGLKWEIGNMGWLEVGNWEWKWEIGNGDGKRGMQERQNS